MRGIREIFIAGSQNNLQPFWESPPLRETGDIFRAVDFEMHEGNTLEHSQIMLYIEHSYVLDLIKLSEALKVKKAYNWYLDYLFEYTKDNSGNILKVLGKLIPNISSKNIFWILNNWEDKPVYELGWFLADPHYIG